MATLLTIDNLDIIDIYFNKYTKARIFGKGPSFQILEKDADTTLHVCVNDSFNHIPEVDILTTNDIEVFDYINLEKMKTLKFLICPDHPHLQGIAHPNITWESVYDKIKNHFNGIMIVYNLRTWSSPNDKFISFPSAITGSNTSNDFVCLFLNKYIKEIDFYGIAKLVPPSTCYNDLFKTPFVYNYNN